MKKSFYAIGIIIYLSLFLLLLSGCEEKKPEGSSLSIETRYKINNYIYDYTNNNLINGNAHKSYIPESLRTELNRYVLINNNFYTFFQVLFPKRIYIYEYSYVYDCHSDNGEWVDSLLISLEEERLGSEIEKMEKLINSRKYVPDESLASLRNERRSNSENIKEMVNSSNTLELMEFGKEIFLPEKRGDKWVFIDACEENVTRSFYDNLFRCTLVEKWKIDKEGQENLVKSSETKFYENTYKPVYKKVSSDGRSELKKYNTDGYLISEVLGSIVNNREYTTSKTDLKYNKDNQVIESVVTDYLYEGDDFQKVPDEFVKKYVYKYNSDDIPPNFDYYEDGILRISNIYTSSDTYVHKVFFEEGFYVTAFYENGKLIKEEFTLYNNTERTKSYE